MEIYTNVNDISWNPHPIAEGVEIKAIHERFSMARAIVMKDIRHEHGVDWLRDVHRVNVAMHQTHAVGDTLLHGTAAGHLQSRLAIDDYRLEFGMLPGLFSGHGLKPVPTLLDAKVGPPSPRTRGPKPPGPFRSARW